MSYKTLFCLGITTVLVGSFAPAMTARASTDLINVEGLPFIHHQSHRVALEEYQSLHLVFASEETKSSGVPQGSSRPPRG